jgi:alpha-D-ribose 1-methylphosphonate 5-triphosphate synthase subunit PhnG
VKIPPRNLWIRALTAHSPQKLISLAETLTIGWQVNYKSLPQAGLSLLQMEDGVFHQPYYLGEIPVASVWIELSNSNDSRFEGAALVMDDSLELAVALAVFDAVMVYQLPGWRKVADLIELGLKKRAQEEGHRSAMLAKTKVDFSLLNQQEDDSED